MGLSLSVLNNNATPFDMDGIDSVAVDKLAHSMRNYTWAQLDALTGGLSKPSKMPCHSFSISAKRCKVGSALRNVKGSTCASCYALKGRYVFPNVEAAMERRWRAMMTDSNEWTAAMVASIRKAKETHFRWHDSGDLQGINHLEIIDFIAHLTPNVMHWLPTREYALIREFKANGWGFSRNLTVRVSLPMIGSLKGSEEWSTYSSVDVVPADGTSNECPSSSQGNKCLDCRACWDSSIRCISYMEH
jgi:hypothetical protein